MAGPAEARRVHSAAQELGVERFMRTVIADDDARSSTHLAHLLEAFTQVELVGVAVDGEQAVELVDRLLPDLLFIDIDMPKLDGFQVLKDIAHQPLVVIVTGHSEYRHLSLETDAIYCLTKPVDAAQVRKAMDKIDRIARIVARIGARPDGT